MKPKNSLLYGIVTMRCPKCREGKMFPKGTLYTTQFMKMNSHCAKCGQSFMPEPGYYFGAMFVSYALNTALFVAVWLGLILFLDEVSTTQLVVALIFTIVALLPITFRLSRVLWIYIFIRYKSDQNKSV
jgi:uncharacterized protein (DUF983 family)